MKFKVFLIASLLNLNSRATLAQIVSAESNNSAQVGTIPGFYYEPTGELSPSWTEMEGAETSGSIQSNYSDSNQYNLQRVWQRGSTPERIVKVGDITKNPHLKSLIDIEGLTLRKIAANGGADIDIASLKSVGLINSMSLGEFLTIFPQLQYRSIQDVVLINESIDQIGQKLDIDLEVDRERVLAAAEKLLVTKLAQNPAFEKIPLEALVDGDWGELISQQEQKLLTEIMTRYPELEKVPIDKLFPITEGIISGDWHSILQRAQQVAIAKGKEISTRELLKLLPELKNIPLGVLPIEELVVGDIEGLADLALGKVPTLADRYISELGNLSQNPGSILAIDTAALLLTGDIFGRLDLAYAGEVETPVTHVLSGGTRNQKFQPEPCYRRSCKHFEITDVLSGIGGEGNLRGKAWVQGSSQ